jgi:hypothetical protein
MKKLISHRGNINGPIPHNENHPEYIDEAIHAGFDVEVDMWWEDGKVFLGHDKPQYEVTDKWLSDRIDKLWVHCKNIELLPWIQSTNLHYFWHENDKYTLTSKNILWVYPGQKLTANSICVMPEINNINKYILSECLGVCSDHIITFYEKNNSSQSL